MARNESVFLPIWLRYYSRFFDAGDIYVIDHLTNDGSIESCEQQFDFNVVREQHPAYNDMSFYTRRIERQQRELLTRYDWVVFAEPDEIVWHPAGLDAYVDAMEHDAICCSGFQIWHNPTEEPSLDLDRTVLSQRRLWYRDRSYDKALLTSTPQRYSFGFHTAVPRQSPVGRLPVPLQPWTSHRWRLLRSASKRIVARSQLGVRDPDLLLLHLHSADFDLAHQKHRRVAHYSDYDDRFDHERTYARLTDDSFGQWYFKPRENSALAEIPQSIRDADFV